VSRRPDWSFASKVDLEFSLEFFWRVETFAVAQRGGGCEASGTVLRGFSGDACSWFLRKNWISGFQSPLYGPGVRPFYS
jgi:hypothetical protein